jgi:cytochrome b561
MPLRNTAEAYGSLSKFLHWSIVVLIIAQYFLAEAAEEAGDDTPAQASLLGWHISVGMLVLLLALVRIGWKAVNKGDPAPLGEVAWQRKSAAIGHGILYLLILAQPVSGWVMASAAGAPIQIFDWIHFPALTGTDHDLHETLEEVHEVLFYVLVVVAALHIVAALYHHFVLKDGTLRRMLPFHRA